ncbi:MAG: DMT family transporter [Clostridiales bacterium]|nr:DMT family transporter [Clostridiales bacterium]
MGFIFAIISGAAMSVQGVMNTRLGEKIGMYESNMYVQGTAFILSLIVMWIMGSGNLRAIGEVNKLYLFGGVLGLVITLTVMNSMSRLSPTVAISTILIAQLITAALIDAFGWMDSEKIAFDWTKYAGIALMLGGVLLFKWQR